MWSNGSRSVIDLRIWDKKAVFDCLATDVRLDSFIPDPQVIHLTTYIPQAVNNIRYFLHYFTNEDLEFF